MTRRTWGFLDQGQGLEGLGNALNWAAIVAFPVLLWFMFV
jgi:hypothetical protein